MPFDPLLADMRFGFGRAPGIAAPDSAQAMLDGLTAADDMATQFRIQSFEAFLPRMQDRVRFARIRKKHPGTARAEEARLAIGALNRAARVDQAGWLAAHVMRRAHSPTPFRERLEDFWADHFTAGGKSGLLRFAGSPYVESAIRPHLTGRFEDLLIAAATHPLMVHYLDQDRSFGPDSEAAQGRGLNENLGREIMELHTLGVGGPYTQTDVRELSKLLTGLTFNARDGRAFYGNRAEPGTETVLGQTYQGGLAHIEAALRDLARHPATARHIAGKLAVHLVSDTPDPALVAAVEAAWLETDGDLMAVYAALLGHPAAWQGAGNVKTPLRFVASACRALAVPPSAFADAKTTRSLLAEPMKLMGQDWQHPGGPDGLEEADSAWITPQGMAARLQWAVSVPSQLVVLPDPRAFVDTALGARADEAVRFAARAAESRADGVGLILASPAFQRS